ncbi:MAG TPA: response regulator [Burkholderiales bacterium]|nr:response regulator [Burkholderiales bacterium]
MTTGEVSSAYKSEHPEGSRKLRILVVDDERDMVLTLATLLRDEGHLVEGVYTAKEVMPEVKNFDPDVVLVDIALPDGSGYAVAEQIRRRAGPHRPMLIALTGIYRRPPHSQLSRVVGCDHFLTKPFEIHQLLELIAPLTLESGPAPR